MYPLRLSVVMILERGLEGPGLLLTHCHGTYEVRKGEISLEPRHCNNNSFIHLFITVISTDMHSMIYCNCVGIVGFRCCLVCLKLASWRKPVKCSLHVELLLARS